jgi:hypothetical protein
MSSPEGSGESRIYGEGDGSFSSFSSFLLLSPLFLLPLLIHDSNLLGGCGAPMDSMGVFGYLGGGGARAPTLDPPPARGPSKS